MRDLILSFPKQFKQGLKTADRLNLATKTYKRVVFVGMGASGWPSEIISAWLNSKTPFYIRKNYGLPEQADRESLIVCVSYSGDTEETVSAYQEALDKKIDVATITSGGKLKKLAQKNDSLLIEIPGGLVPRMGTGYIFTAIYAILKKTGLTENRDQEILALEELLEPKKWENPGKKLSEEINGKIPLFYTSEKLNFLGFIWKIKINENSKSPAFNSSFPELNHNEIEGNGHGNESRFRNDPIFYSLILKDKEDLPLIQKRMDLTSQILNQSGTPSKIIDLMEVDFLEKIFSSILLSDWASYYLAEKYEVDPLVNPTIDLLKEKMKN